MSYRRPGSVGGGFFGFPPAISQLVLINVIVYLLENLIARHLGAFVLVPAEVVRGHVWELVSYMFLHGSFTHILFNMFLLVMFGSEIERWWGSREFLKYYFVTGIGGGLVHVLWAYVIGKPQESVIGASAAVLGVLLAYGMTFPNRQVLFMFVIPISARTMVVILALMDLAFGFAPGRNDLIAHFAHLGGMLTGYIYLKWETLSWRGKRWYAHTRNRLNSETGRRSDRRDEVLQEEMDRILDKIRTEGIGSLTPDEKRKVQEWGERARRRQRGGDDG